MSEEVALKNLGGFFKKGARAKAKSLIPTGHFDLDFALKYGQLPAKVDLGSLDGYDPRVPLGLPRGRIVELFGDPGSGKSSLAYRVVGYAQRLGFTAAWIDTEHSFEESLAELNGCDVDSLLFSDLFDEDNPEKNYFAEDIFDNINEICKTDQVQVVVLDSVANLVPKRRAEVDAGKQTIAELARLMSEQMGLVSHFAAKHDVLVIFINQTREQPGIMFGDSTTTPGGKALKFNASIRLQMTKRSSAKESIFIESSESETGKLLIGRNSGLKIEKNRMGPPLTNSEGGNVILSIPIYYRPYFPDLGERLFDTGRQLKIIRIYKGTYSWKDPDSNEDVKGDTREAFMENARSNNLFDKLFDHIVNTANESGIILQPEILSADLDRKSLDVTVEATEPTPDKPTRGRKAKDN